MLKEFEPWITHAHCPCVGSTLWHHNIGTASFTLMIWWLLYKMNSYHGINKNGVSEAEHHLGMVKMASYLLTNGCCSLQREKQSCYIEDYYS